MSDLPWNLSYFRDPDFIAAPVALPATAIDEDRFTANWEPVEEAVSYELEIAADLSFDELETPGGVPLGVDALEPLEPLEFALSGLAPETEYFYRVRAVKASGSVSAWSNVVTLETLELFTAQGGDLVTYDGEYSRHYFTTIGSADFEVLTGLRRVRRLIVAGGGQGGGVNGSGVSCGGGGGGGVLDLAEEDRDPMAPGVYPAVVGKGGSVPGALNVGEDGDDSSFDGDTAIGGGHGGSAGSSVGNGGSGGGATNSAGGPELGGVGTVGQGFDGGDANNLPGGGGGGGGAGEPGENGTAPEGGDGGDGLESDISGEAEHYGAGGGGAARVANFEPIGAIAGAGGLGGGGAGRANSAGPGGAASGIGAGGGGAIGNNPGGVGTKGRVVLKYKGRAADVTPPPPDPAPYRGPITFDGCTREQEVDGVEILVDCNARIDSGIFPDYQRYLCIGGGVVQSSRSMRPDSLPSELPDDPLPGGENDVTNGTLVFRFSQPIRAFKITRRVTPGTDQAPILHACDNYTVVPHPSSVIPGSSKDGAITNWRARSPALIYYPTLHLEPPVNLAAEEEMEILFDFGVGFSCVVIDQPTKFPSEFVDPMFILLSD